MILYSKKIKSSCWDLVWHFGTQLAFPAYLSDLCTKYQKLSIQYAEMMSAL